jgi:hypothetical protein
VLVAMKAGTTPTQSVCDLDDYSLVMKSKPLMTSERLRSNRSFSAGVVSFCIHAIHVNQLVLKVSTTTRCQARWCRREKDLQRAGKG